MAFMRLNILMWLSHDLGCESRGYCVYGILEYDNTSVLVS